jgi:predicted AAA+ superfamily ATPase
MRYLSEIIGRFADSKFVFLAGPRQVGKTTLGQEWLSKYRGLYLNWDAIEDRQRILKRDYLADPKLEAILFDEIHKYRVWKSYLKGLYDKESRRLRVLITGSARLDLYQRGGESMFGRYELLRLHPYSVGELTAKHYASAPPDDFLKLEPEQSNHQEIWHRLERFGGFPEPYHTADPLQHSRWSLRRRELLIKEDLRDLSEVKMVDQVEHLYLLLPERVGAPLSINSLREEVQVAFNTVSSWIGILDRLYISYRVSPYHRGLARSLKKEQKLYLWDWSQIENAGARFENMVASHLMKSLQMWTDLGYGEYDLAYFRDREKNEVDFVVTRNRKPILVLECKLNDTQIHPPLVKLAESLGGVPCIQLVHQEGIEKRRGNSLVVTASRFFSGWI